MINTVDPEQESRGREYIGRTKWPTRREEGMKRDGACESVSRFATTGLRPGYKKTLLRGRRRGASAIQRSAHPATLAAGWTLTRSDQYRMESTPRESTRLDSLRLSPPFTLVHQAANFKILLNRIKRKVSYGSSELEGEAVDDSKRLISLVEKSLYIYIHVYSLSFRFVSSHSSEG